MKSRLLYPVLSMILALALASTACALGAQEPTPAPTDIPASATPVPPMATPTPAPTDTPTPLPTATATPNRTATAAFEATQQAEAVVADIQAFLSNLDLPTEGRLGWYQTEAANVDLDGYQANGFAAFAESVEATDFIFKTDMTWESTGWPTCGLLFRSDATLKDYYWLEFLRLSGLPGWTISYYKDGYYVFSPTGSSMRFSDMLNQKNGSTNEIVLFVEENKFTVYINGAREGRFFDDSKKSMQGYFAFAAWHESGKTTCTYENSWVWLSK